MRDVILFLLAVVSIVGTLCLFALTLWVTTATAFTMGLAIGVMTLLVLALVGLAGLALTARD